MAFSNHRGGVDQLVCWVLVGATLVEIPVVHLLVHHWSARLAWTLTGLGVLGLLYLAAFASSFCKFPIMLDDQFLLLRLGFAQKRRIDRKFIVGLDWPPRATTRQKAAGGVKIIRFWLVDPPNLALQHQTPRGIEQIEFRVDEPAKLKAALAVPTLTGAAS